MVTKVCPNIDCPDIELFGVQGKYADKVDVCAKCGASLVIQDGDTPERKPTRPEFRNLVPLCAPNTPAELAVFKSLLQAEGIFFFVHNEFFGAMKVGISIPLINQRTILVADEDLERARELIFLPDTLTQEMQHRYGVLDLIRMTVEALAFGWIIPNPRHPYSE